MNRTQTFQFYHCISLFRLGIWKLVKHFLPKHHLCDKGTWLSGKLWAVKWMLHDIMQTPGISCLIHNIPLSVQDKKLKKTHKSFTSNIILTDSNPAAYIWGNSDAWESLAKPLDLYVAEWRSRFFFFVRRKILSHGTSGAVLNVLFSCSSTFFFLSHHNLLIEK